MAQEKSEKKFDYTYFNQMPILDSGRVKPIGAFAKARLKDFYGRDTNASAWLAETIFNPSAAANAQIFQIKNDDLKARLGIDPDTDIFNITELQSGLESTQEDVIALLQNEQEDLTAEQKALLKIHEDVISYNELLRPKIHHRKKR